MAETNATLTLFGDPISVRVTRSQGGIIIRDAQGHTFDLPQGVGVDFSSGQLYYNNEIVGEISPFNFVSLPLEDLEDLSSTASSGSAGGGAAFTSNDPATGTSAAATAGTENTGIGDGTSTTGRGFVTGTLEDGGARVPKPVVKPPVKPIHSYTPMAEVDTDAGPASTERQPGPGSSSTPRTPAPGGAPRETPLTGISSPRLQSTLGAISGLLGTVQLLGKRWTQIPAMRDPYFTGSKSFGNYSAWEKLSGFGKTVAVAGVAVSSVSLFLGMFSLGKQFSWAGAANSAMSAISLYMSLAAIGPSGWAAIAIIGIIAAAGYLLGIFLKDDKREGNKLNPALGDSGAMPNAGPWYEALAKESNGVYMILTGFAFAVIGIHLSVGSPPVQEVPITIAQLPGVRDLVASDVDKPLDPYPESVMGKVFIQSAGNNGLTPDKVVYVSKESDGKYFMRMVSLDYKGKVVGDLPPGMGRPSMFGVVNGAIVPTPEGNAAVAHLLAMGRTANAPGADPASRAAAAHKGGMAGSGDRTEVLVP